MVGMVKTGLMVEKISKAWNYIRRCITVPPSLAKSI